MRTVQYVAPCLSPFDKENQCPHFMIVSCGYPQNSLIFEDTEGRKERRRVKARADRKLLKDLKNK